MNKIVYPKIILATAFLTTLTVVYALAVEKPIKTDSSMAQVKAIENLVEGTKTNPEKTETPSAPERETFQFIEIKDSCGPNYTGSCVNLRSAPSATSQSWSKLRNGVVLKVDSVVTEDGHDWYKIKFDEGVRYSERIKGDWYVSADFARLFSEKDIPTLSETPDTQTTKRILVDRSEQMLYAYDGDELFMKERVSTGLDLTPTPRGNFKIYKKTPSRYMQGPLPGISNQYYDLPGVPWNLYFTEQGGVIHGAYWHNQFGKKWSHGCVNLPLDKAEGLYYWADIGTPVVVRD